MIQLLLLVGGLLLKNSLYSMLGILRLRYLGSQEWEA